MKTTLEQLEHLIESDEDENLEFKRAGNQYDSNKLVEYCAALANEGGGAFILGVTDKKPRKVVGTSAFAKPGRLKPWLLDKLGLRVEVDEVEHPNGRVLVFSVPSRAIGMPIHVNDKYLMRSGESLVPMSSDKLRSIFDEAGPDFSAEICEKATMEDLSTEAIEDFRRRWLEKSGNKRLAQQTPEQLLEDAELIENGKLTYAALILLGTHKALGRHLAQAEVIFEWRNRDGEIKYHQRREYREGFLLFHDQLWGQVEQRNEVFQYQDGLFRKDIPSFRESVVREAVLNAVAHRDYRDQGSVFVRLWPSRMEIVSPGGFPQGITPENLLWLQRPRNRRLAEAFGKCGLVERSGQGADLMFELCMRDSKALPDFKKSEEHHVWVDLSGQVQDALFVKYLEKISREKQLSFGVEDLLVLAAIHDGREPPSQLTVRLKPLLHAGAIERVAKHSRTFILSHQFYKMAGRKGEYTLKRGLDRETNKSLLEQYILDNPEEGARLAELKQVLPQLSSIQVRRLVYELRDENRVHFSGATKGSRWFPGPVPDLNQKN